MRARLLPPLLAALLLWAIPSLAGAPLSGTWMSTIQDNRLQLHLRTQEGRGTMGLQVPRAAFQGLSTEEGATAPFRLEREAGTLHFEGRFAQGEGAGHYRFEPSESFGKAMAALGYSKLTPGEQLQLALFDVGPRFIRDLEELGYRKLDLDMLLAFRIHGVTPDFIREMRSVGYPNLTPDELVALRVHAIDASFVRSLSRTGSRSTKTP